MAPPSQITLSGRIERIKYHNRENHFTIARLKTDENQRSITIKGTMPTPRIGETIEVRGDWETHPRYGQQLKFNSFIELLPSTVEGIRNYLESGFIKGVGTKLVDRIIGHFHGDTLTVIEKDPERLTEVTGIGKKTALRISEAWHAHHCARQLMVFLEKIGVDTAHAPRLLQTYGNDVIDILCNDPYQVAQDLPRIGFSIADAVVRNADTPVDEMDRAQACMIHLLERAVDQGHAYTEKDDLIRSCDKEFDIEETTVSIALDQLDQSGSIVVTREPGVSDSAEIFPKLLYQAETLIARRITAMQAIPVADTPQEGERIFQELVDRLPITLSPQQKKVLFEAMHHKVSIVTGGPGTGKTTLVQSITAVMEKMGHRVMLAAPTGRAARRLSEVTGKPAATLHKSLGYNLADGCFERTEDHPLTADVIIVDEASMVDILLMAHLIRAVPVTSTLILVGDVFQLPSVGPGNVLADLIHSGTVMTFELTEIFRQNSQSRIVANAHLIRNGMSPIMDPPDDADMLSEFYFIEEVDPLRVAETVVRLCRQEIPRHFRKDPHQNMDPIRDIQVLTPMHRGSVGTLQLNRQLQSTLNPAGDQVAVMGNRFRTGDKVMHLRNNYKKEVFNGDIGIMHSIDLEEEKAEVEYDDRIVSYDFMELDELSLAYAISVHKSQGSEYPAVVIPLVTQHYIMLQRNLLYTALTRGKQLVVIVGSTKALKIALKNDRPRQRRSMLAHHLNPDGQAGNYI